jgi:hypothetical protein
MTLFNKTNDSPAPLDLVVGPRLNFPDNGIPDNMKLFYARALLSHLWARYDANGISMGRSFDSMLLELAIEMLGRDNGPMPKEFLEPGVLLNRIKDELSRARLESMGMQRPNTVLDREPPLPVRTDVR